VTSTGGVQNMLVFGGRCGTKLCFVIIVLVKFLTCWYVSTVKLLERAPPSLAEVKNVWTLAATLPVHLWHGA